MPGFGIESFIVQSLVWLVALVLVVVVVVVVVVVMLGFG